jgi:hypothetical protein
MQLIYLKVEDKHKQVTIIQCVWITWCVYLTDLTHTVVPQQHETWLAQYTSNSDNDSSYNIDYNYWSNLIKANIKYTLLGKGFALQAGNGSRGSMRLRLLDLLDFRHYEGGKVVTLTHRPSLPPGVFLVLISRGWVDPRAHGSVGSFGKNPQRHHWGSIPRPSD